jgi:hypothetical protein
VTTCQNIVNRLPADTLSAEMANSLLALQGEQSLTWNQEGTAMLKTSNRPARRHRPAAIDTVFSPITRLASFRNIAAAPALLTFGTLNLRPDNIVIEEN